MADFASAIVDGIFNLGSTLGNTALSSGLDWHYYKKQSKLDWEYYRDKYAPLNQQLQNEMFDYQTAGNLKAQGDLIGVKKNALLENGYNPILAINGGVSGSVSPGSTGSLGSPHSAHGISANIVPMKLDIMKNAIDMDLARQQKLSLEANTAADLQVKKAQVAKSSADLSKTLAETEKIKGNTPKEQAEIDEIREKIKKSLIERSYPGYMGKEYRSLISMFDDLFQTNVGDRLRESTNSSKKINVKDVKRDSHHAWDDTIRPLE